MDASSPREPNGIEDTAPGYAVLDIKPCDRFERSGRASRSSWSQALAPFSPAPLEHIATARRRCALEKPVSTFAASPLCFESSFHQNTRCVSNASCTVEFTEVSRRNFSRDAQNSACQFCALPSTQQAFFESIARCEAKRMSGRKFARGEHANACRAQSRCRGLLLHPSLCKYRNSIVKTVCSLGGGFYPLLWITLWVTAHVGDLAVPP